jgi:hypothetical protein
MSANLIEKSDGYKKLLAAVEKDEGRGSAHSYREKLAWVVARAEQYAEKTGISAADILNAWEERRDYWYMNYYQECEQPEIKAGSVRVFDTVDAMLQSIGKGGFRCPNCEQVTRSPYACDSGAMVELMNHPGEKHPCNWKVYGLLGHFGKGVYVFVKEKVCGENMFMPIAWEPVLESATA